MKPTRIAQASREYASSRCSRGRDFSNPFLERATTCADPAREVREAPVRRAVRRGFRQDLEHRRLHDALPLVAERAVRQGGQLRRLAGRCSRLRDDARLV